MLKVRFMWIENEADCQDPEKVAEHLVRNPNKEEGLKTARHLVEYFALHKRCIASMRLC